MTLLDLFIESSPLSNNHPHPIHQTPMTQFTEQLRSLHQSITDQLQEIEAQKELYQDKLAYIQSQIEEGSQIPNTEVVSDPVIEEALKKSKRLGRESVLKMRDEFRGLSKIDAVQRVLADRAGQRVHLEDIITKLYGDLSRDELTAEKTRIGQVMTRGMKKGLPS